MGTAKIYPKPLVWGLVRAHLPYFHLATLQATKSMIGVKLPVCLCMLTALEPAHEIRYDDTYSTLSTGSNQERSCAKCMAFDLQWRRHQKMRNGVI